MLKLLNSLGSDKFTFHKYEPRFVSVLLKFVYVGVCLDKMWDGPWQNGVGKEQCN